MGIIVNNNLAAANTARNLSGTYGKLGTSIQRMSTGLRVNSASDDAAGLAIREMMRADITATQQGIRNAADAVSLIQTADGSLGVIDEKLTRMKELAEQAATGTYTTVQRDIINSEYQAMAAEIDRIANATNFNGIKLLDGSVSNQHGGQGIKVHFGTGNEASEDYYFIKIGDARATSSTGLRVGGDAKNDIWGQGGSASGELAGPGCCTNGFDSLNGQAGFISGQTFSYGYNWDWTEDTDEKLISGKYLAGRYAVGSSDSLQDLVLKVNAGTQSRVGLRVDGDALNSAVGLGSGTVAVCIGNETYYWGDAEEVEGNEVTRVKSTYKATATYFQNANGKLNTVDQSAASAFSLKAASAEVTVDGQANSALGAEALNAAMDKRFTHTIMNATDPDSLMEGRDPAYDGEKLSPIQAAKGDSADRLYDAAIEAAQDDVKEKQAALDEKVQAVKDAVTNPDAGIAAKHKAKVDEYFKHRSQINDMREQSGGKSDTKAAGWGNEVEYNNVINTTGGSAVELDDDGKPTASAGTDTVAAYNRVKAAQDAQDELFAAQKALSENKALKDSAAEAKAVFDKASATLAEKEDGLKNNSLILGCKDTVTGLDNSLDTEAYNVLNKTGGSYDSIAADTGTTASGTATLDKQNLVKAYVEGARKEARSGATNAAPDAKLLWTAFAADGTTGKTNKTDAAEADLPDGAKNISEAFKSGVAAYALYGYGQRFADFVNSIDTTGDTEISDAYVNQLETAFNAALDDLTNDGRAIKPADKQTIKGFYKGLVQGNRDNTRITANINGVSDALGRGIGTSNWGQAISQAAEALGYVMRANDERKAAGTAKEEAQKALATATAKSPSKAAKDAVTKATGDLANAKTGSGTYQALSDADKSAVDAWLSAMAYDNANGLTGDKATATAKDVNFTTAVTADPTATPPVLAVATTQKISDIFGPQGTAADDKLLDKAGNLGIAQARLKQFTAIGEAVSATRVAKGDKGAKDIATELSKATASAITAWGKDQTSAGVAVKAGKDADGKQLYLMPGGATTLSSADALKGAGTRAIKQTKEDYVNAQVKDLIDQYTTMETGVYVDNKKNATSAEVLYDQAKKAGWHEATVNIGADLSAFVQNQINPGGHPMTVDELTDDINATVTQGVRNQTDGGQVYTAKAYEATDIRPDHEVQAAGLTADDVGTRSYVEREAGIVDSGNQKVRVAANGEGSKKYTASALAEAINTNKNSDYWAMTQTVKNKLGQDESMVYVFSKEGGDNNGILACEQAGRANGSASTAAAAAIDFQNMETGEFHEAGTKMSLGGEHWATMTPQQTKSNKGHEVWNVTLNGRDVGKERDLWITDKGELELPGLDESNIQGLTRDGFHEIQNAANAEWAGAEVRTQSSAQEALAALDEAIVNKDKIRADLGALQNRLENTMTNLEIQSENLQASESRISDVDTAKEMTEFTKNNVLTQAGVSMLSQANSLSQLALSLMR